MSLELLLLSKRKGCVSYAIDLHVAYFLMIPIFLVSAYGDIICSKAFGVALAVVLLLLLPQSRSLTDLSDPK